MTRKGFVQEKKRWKRSALRWITCICLCLFFFALFGCGGGGSEEDDDQDSPDDNYSITFTNIQYRNFESGTGRCATVVGIDDNGGPIVDTDVVDLVMEDSSSSAVVPTSSGFYHTQSLNYDCTSGSCNPAQSMNGTGFYSIFSNLSADSYTMDIEMENGQILTDTISFPGIFVLPYISSSSMAEQWNGGDLQLSWTNPTDDPSWIEVDQLVIRVLDDLDNEVLWIRMAPTAESVTIPAALVAQAEILMGGSSLHSWYIQTIAMDSDGMEFSRGYSNRVTIDNYSIGFALIQYRNFESGTDRYATVVTITDDGDPIVDTDVVDLVMTDSSASAMTPTNDGFFHAQSLSYDCTSGTCSPALSMGSTGFFGLFSNLPADSYTMDIEMENGQMLATTISFPGILVLPYISSSSMTEQWNGGDLQLSWTNPTGDPAWSEVDQLVIRVYDDLGNEVLWVRMAPTAESVTIPAALVAQAETLLGGTSLNMWHIQTLAFDSNDMEFSRSYSSMVIINTP